MRAIFSKPTSPASPGQHGVWSFDTLLSSADEGNSRTRRPRNRWKPEQLRRRETSVQRGAEGGHEARPCSPALKLCADTAGGSARGKVDGGGTWPGASWLPRSGDGTATQSHAGRTREHRVRAPCGQQRERSSVFVFLVRNTADKELAARESLEWKRRGRRQKLCICTGEAEQKMD